MKKFNFVYKTTFNDGRYYIGQHKTDNLEDGYFGSGKIVRDLVKEHPELEPKRTILKECSTQKELNYWEKYYIADNWSDDPLCLNNSNRCSITEIGSWYGHHRTEETKRKIGESRKGKFIGENNGFYGRHHTEESKRKMSESQKGEKSYMYGKHLSEETKRKLSEANKGKYPSEETRKKLSESHKGIYPSEDTRKKLSEVNKGKNNPMFGKHHTEETRKKMSESHKRENSFWYGKHLSDETRKKMSESRKGKHRVYDNEEHTKWHFEF